MKQAFYASGEPGDLPWDLYAAGALCLFFFFQIIQWPLFPKFLDIYYHLSAAKGFADAGGYPADALWEYAPAGRPHLYPPLLHMMMLGLHRLGLPWIEIGRLTDVLVYPLVLFTIWHVLRNVFSPRVAFFTLVIFSSSFTTYLAAVILAPFSLALLIGLFAFLSVENAKTLPAGLGLAACFYTHTLMAWLFFFSFLAYGIWRRELFPVILKVLLVGCLAASPLLFHQAVHRDYFTFVQVRENHLLELDILVYFLAVLGFWAALRRKGPSLFFLCLGAVMLSLLLLGRQARFFSGQGSVGFMVLAALALDEFYGKIPEKSGRFEMRGLFMIAALVFFYWAAPVVNVDLETKEIRLNYFNRTMSRYLLPDPRLNFQGKGASIYFEKNYKEILDAVRAHSEKGDILWGNFNYAAGVVALLADRSTSTAMLPEVRPYEPIDPQSAAKLLIWFKEPDGNIPKGMNEAVARYGLKRAAETGMVYIYQNPSGGAQTRFEKPVVPEPVLHALLAALMIYAGFNFLRPPLQENQPLR